VHLNLDAQEAAQLLDFNSVQHFVSVPSNTGTWKVSVTVPPKGAKDRVLNSAILIAGAQKVNTKALYRKI